MQVSSEANGSNRTAISGGAAPSWLQRDVTLNWLALGLLLAAWNSADDAGCTARRPQPLQGYSYVTVRAITQKIPFLDQGS
ncbi:MAG TPA: hypothetical protein VHY75_01560 [Steroidobacteraceae bacterium]|nr:hypothetical protein [Steroidobacteraceae bacterium]